MFVISEAKRYLREQTHVFLRPLAAQVLSRGLKMICRIFNEPAVFHYSLLDSQEEWRRMKMF